MESLKVENGENPYPLLIQVLYLAPSAVSIRYTLHLSDSCVYSWPSLHTTSTLGVVSQVQIPMKKQIKKRERKGKKSCVFKNHPCSHIS